MRRTIKFLGVICLILINIFFLKIQGVAIFSDDDGDNDDDDDDKADDENMSVVIMMTMLMMTMLILSKEEVVVFIYNRDGNQNIMTMTRAVF